MKHLLLILTIIYSVSSFGQSDRLLNAWTDGFYLYSSDKYNDSLIVFSGSNLHEGGYMFTLKINRDGSYTIIGDHPESDYSPSVGHIDNDVVVENIDNTKILIVKNSNGEIQDFFREIKSGESLEKIMINNKINFQLSGKYVDVHTNEEIIFLHNEQKAKWLSTFRNYEFEYEYDFPLNVISFKNNDSFFYEKTLIGLDIFKAKRNKYDYWEKAEKVKSLRKIEWFNPSNNKRLLGKYPFASTDFLIGGILSCFEKKELRIMRNEIFARHGYKFKTIEMRRYFESQPWYVPRFDDVNKHLTELERLNIKLIKRFEN